MSRQYIIGRDTRTDGWLCGERSVVEEYAFHHLAVARSQTWGEFLGIFSPGDHLELRTWGSFALYIADHVPEVGPRSITDLWHDYLALDNMTDRPPLEHERFDAAAYRGWHRARKAVYASLRRHAAGWMPHGWSLKYVTFNRRERLADPRHGTIEPQVFDQAITALEQEEGGVIIEDQLLIDGAADVASDWDAVFHRVAQNDAMERAMRDAAGA